MDLPAQIRATRLERIIDCAQHAARTEGVVNNVARGDQPVATLETSDCRVDVRRIDFVAG